MAEILSADEIDVLLSTIGYNNSIYDIYINKKNNKEYYVLQEVLNKTNDTVMIMYKERDDNLKLYVREKEDFFNKFIKKENNMACGSKSKSKKPKKK